MQPVGPINNPSSFPVPARFIHGHDLKAAGKTVAKLAGLAAAGFGSYLAVRHGWPLLADYPQVKGAAKFLLGVNGVASVAQIINQKVNKYDVVGEALFGGLAFLAQIPFGVGVFYYLDMLGKALKESAAEFMPIPTFSFGARVLTAQKGFWHRLIDYKGRDTIERRLLTVGHGKWLPEIINRLHTEPDFSVCRFYPCTVSKKISPEFSARFSLAVLKDPRADKPREFDSKEGSKIFKPEIEKYLSAVMGSPFISEEEKSELRKRFPHGYEARQFSYSG